MRYNTGNPVGPDGSSSPFDLHDNAGIADQLVTGTERQYPNRIGVPIRSFNGMNRDFDESQAAREDEFSQAQDERDAQYQQKLTAMGWLVIGDYAAGLTISTGDQVFKYEGEYYKPKASTALPYTTTGVWANESNKFLSVGDGVLRQELAQPTGDTLVKTRSGRTQRQKNDEWVSVADYGGTPTGDSTASVAAAAAAAGPDGQIYIPFSSFTVSSANAGGCRVLGANTKLTGMIINHSGMRGVSVNGFSQDNHRNFLPEPCEKNPMLVQRVSSSLYRVMSRKQGRRGGGIMTEVIRDVVTADNSLGGSAQLLRAAITHNCTGIYSWRGTANATDGTWEDFIIPAANLGHGSDNIYRDTTIRRSNSVNAYAEFNVSVSRGQKINVAIYGTAGGTSAAEVLVDGVVVAAVNPQSFANQLYPIEISVPPGSRVVRVRNASGISNYLYVAGVNFHSIDQVHARFTYDNWSVYRNSSLTHYLNTTGANDYAIFDADAQLWGGSFHGGETASSQSLVIGGSQVSMVDGQISATDDFYIRQITTIDWSGAGGGIVSTESLLTFLDGQTEMKASFRPAAGTTPNIQRFHTGMNSLSELFTRVVFPQSLSISTSEIPLGQISKVVMRDSVSNALAVTEFDIHADIESDRGGAYVAPAAGSYNKVYYSWVMNGRKAFTGLAFTCRRTYR
ncbi:hypothetical protein IE322_05725 [Pseudomonas asiatica]|uniref:hypothetical protein n=1 Tax=Pseudomonas asiatica TaxID=2219225 RepID=UPI001749A1C5|nr:hypothetical protein [Pseudomonas asiatica]QOE09560.1 hypothetical protein IE322_05725 [Pseudomonas asiatica]